MDIRLHARNSDLDDGFRRTAEQKLAKATKVYDGIGDLDLEITERTNPRRAAERYKLELTTAAAGRTLRIEAAAATPEAALDELSDRFTSQLRRLKERMIDRSRKAGEVAPPPPPAFDEDEVVRVKQFVMKPMTVEEAALQMDLLGHDFFFFLNAGSDRQSVLYRRKDGRLGLIEPA
ncbi:MAG: sigma 54 modulation/S30EA ribosomal C-terminal domain-containing protein [Acidimicrobiia bacterium]